MVSEAERAARTLNVQLRLVETSGPANIGSAFAEMARERVDGFLLLATPMFFVERARVVDFAAKHRLPAVYPTRQYVDAGGLMSYGASLTDLVRRTATYVDKLLKGAKAGDMPVEQPAKFELVVNLKTAKAFGLTIPPAVLGRADERIE